MSQARIITDKAELDKLIDTIARNGKKLDQDIQTAGISALNHLGKHGDVGFVNRLFLALPKGARKSAMTSWLLAHGALVPNTDTATKKDKPFNYTKDKTTSVEAAQADPWHSHKPDPEPDQVFDLQKALQALLAKAGKAERLAHPELLPMLTALVTPAPEAGEDGTATHEAVVASMAGKTALAQAPAALM